MSGGQIAQGYFKDPEMTQRGFPRSMARDGILRATWRYQDAAGTFHHLGRIDNQVKVLGSRVELEEVEAHLRAILGDRHGSGRGVASGRQPSRRRRRIHYAQGLNRDELTMH